MTREEAILHLQTVARTCVDAGYDPAVEDAIYMAIEALKMSSPCDLCRNNPPSSCDGKACSMCPAEGRNRN